MKLRNMLFTRCIFVALTGISHADISWEQVDTLREGTEVLSLKQNIYITSNQFAIETSEGMKIILDLTDNIVTTIDSNEKTYFTMSFEALEQMKDNIRSETGKMIEEALKHIPEEQRAEYKQQLEQQMKQSEVSSENKSEDQQPWEKVKQTGKTEEILGYTATHYRTTGKDGTIYELWCAKGIDFTELKVLFEKIKNISMFKDISQNYPALSLGFPLRSKETSNENVFSSEVTSISLKPVSGAHYTIPDGFTESQPSFPGIGEEEADNE
ncbi:DUF4412 domain-containing protein [Candidatus Latescibacterota bacterium]